MSGGRSGDPGGQGELLALANTSPTIAEQGGGPVDIEVHHLPDTPTVPMLIVHLLFDVRDAMGANAVNTAAEAIAPALERLERRAGSAAHPEQPDRPPPRLGGGHHPGSRPSARWICQADEVIDDIAHANAFAVADPYRAATHNKGILNGIDAVRLATGNDWRAVEAGAHAYAARDGRYRALTDWRVVPELPAGRPE